MYPNNGNSQEGADVDWPTPRTIQRVHISELLATEGLERVSTDHAWRYAVATEDIMIGESLLP